MLGILACPDVGGDTIIADTAEAYKRLSPAFQTMLSKVSAVHSSRKLISHTKAAKQPVRSDPVNSEHPVIRVHPVTGEKCIFYNEEFPEEVLGLKDREAEAVMRLVMTIIREGHDFQARVHWEKHSVVMFDGRQTLRKFYIHFLKDVLFLPSNSPYMSLNPPFLLSWLRILVHTAFSSSLLNFGHAPRIRI